MRSAPMLEKPRPYWAPFGFANIDALAVASAPERIDSDYVFRHLRNGDMRPLLFHPFGTLSIVHQAANPKL